MLEKALAKVFGDALVDENLLAMRVSKDSLALSSAATAISRVTVGNRSRNASMVSPPSR